MANFFAYDPTKETVLWQEFVNSRPDTANLYKSKYIGNKFFPTVEVPTENIKWAAMKGKSNNLAGFYDYKSIPMGKEDAVFQEYFAKLIRMGAARTIDPDAARKLAMVGGDPNIRSKNDVNIVDRIRRETAQKIEWCLNTLSATKEYLQIKALEGQIVWPALQANGTPFAAGAAPDYWNPDYKLTVNMGYDESMVQNATTLVDNEGNVGSHKAWNHVDANIIKDLEIMRNILNYNSGMDSTNPVVIMSSYMLGVLTNNVSISNYILVPNSSSNYVTKQDVLKFISTKVGIDIVTYDATYTYPDPTTGKAVSVRFLDKNKVILLPSMDTQYGYTATTLQENESGEWVSGVSVFQYKDPKPPYERFVMASEIAFPVVTVLDSHVVLNAMS